jgi:hypothetical protein
VVRYVVLTTLALLVRARRALVTKGWRFIPEGKISANRIAADSGSCLIMFA